MKKISFIIGLAMLLAWTSSCKKNENQDTSSFSASIESDEGGSRTYLDGFKVRWSAGNQIVVYGNGDHKTYSLTAGAGTQVGTFTTTGGVQETDTYRGFYPAASCTGLSGDVFSFSMPSTQTYTAGGFADDLNPMGAKSVGGGETVLPFKNAFAVLKLQTTGNRSVTRVELTVPSGNYVYGNYTFDPTTGTTNYVSGGGQTITLNCPTAVALNASTTQDFYIVLPPGSINNGFTVNYFKDSSATPFYTQTVESTATNISLARNTIKRMNVTANAVTPQVVNLVPEMSSSWVVNYHTNANGPVISAAANTYSTNNNGASISFNTGTASGWNEAQVFAPGTVHLINGHKYYLRWCTRCYNVSGGSTDDWRDSNHEVWFLGSSNVNWIVSTGQNAPNGEQIHINKAGHQYSAAGKTLPTITKGSWQMNSAYRTFTGATGDYQFRIDINNRQKKFGAEIACVMLIDLTADYTGASVPSFNTCDNRSYFVGSEDRDGINW